MRVSTVLASVILICRVVAGQSAVTPRTPTFRSRSELAIIPVSVTDHRGRAVVGLRADEFAIADNGVSQRILSVSQWDAPASIGVVFDASGSMKKNICAAEAGVRMLIDDTTLGDESFLIRFSDSPHLEVPLTEDMDEISSKLRSTSAQGATALFDGIYLALSQVKRARTSHRVLVIITDSGENHSRYTFSELLSAARESDVQIYVLELMGSGSYRERQRGHWRLEQLANETGGRLAAIYQNSHLPDQIAILKSLIRYQLVIAYRPQPSCQDGKWHSVRVRLLPSRKDHKVFAKTGYYAASH